MNNSVRNEKFQLFNNFFLSSALEIFINGNISYAQVLIMYLKRKVVLSVILELKHEKKIVLNEIYSDALIGWGKCMSLLCLNANNAIANSEQRVYVNVF